MLNLRLIQRISIVFLCCLLTACTSPLPFLQNSSGLGTPNETAIYSHRRTSNIWTVLRKDFKLPEETPRNQAVLQQINWYLSNPKVLTRIAEQARPYLFYIYRQVKLRKLPAELTLLPILESSFNPFIYSHVGAAGLWQIMPSTASGYGLKIDWWYDGRRDIIASTHAALDYLSYLGNLFNNQWLLAIAAYDSGEGTINAAISRNLREGKNTDFWNLPLPTETQNYVPKLLALATIIKYIDDYPIDLPEIPDEPYLATVTVDSQIDLAQAAKISQMELSELLKLNPGFNRWATIPNTPARLLLPIDKAAIFQAQVEMQSPYQLITWIQYRVRTKDTLESIARQYHTTAKIIRDVNHLSTHRLTPGKNLLIPTESKNLSHVISELKNQYTSTFPSVPEIKITHYTVKANDTIESIANRYHVKTHQIRFWNGLQADTELKTGQQLILWPSHKYFIKKRFNRMKRHFVSSQTNHPSASKNHRPYSKPHKWSSATVKTRAKPKTKNKIIHYHQIKTQQPHPAAKKSRALKKRL